MGKMNWSWPEMDIVIITVETGDSNFSDDKFDDILSSIEDIGY